MSSKQWLSVAAWAFLPLAAMAQHKHSPPVPTDTTTPVNAAAYESAFKNYRPFSEENETPDALWRLANDEVGMLGGHAGHMKDKPEESAASPKMNPARPGPSGAMDHSKHH